MRDVLQEIVVAGGKGLLDQLDARRRRGGKRRFDIRRLPSLVGIGDQPRIGDGLAHRGQALQVAFAAELELQ